MAYTFWTTLYISHNVPRAVHWVLSVYFLHTVCMWQMLEHRAANERCGVVRLVMSDDVTKIATERRRTTAKLDCDETSWWCLWPG